MTTTKPAKEAVRTYMQQRRTESSAPKTPEQIRQELGWKLIPSNSK